MLRLLGLVSGTIALLTAGLVASAGHGSALYPCAGASAVLGPNAPTTMYPERRVAVETQMWWSPAPVTGKTVHIHVSTCFPLYQTVTSPSVHFDIRVQIHDWDGSGGTVFNPLFGPDGEGLFNLRDLGLFPPTFAGMTDYACPTVQCEGWISWDANVGALPWSGWDQWDFALQGHLPAPFGSFPGDAYPRTLSIWMMNVQNGKPPYPASNVYGCSDNSCASRAVGGQSWFPPEDGFGSKYARANLPRDQLDKLWDESTGQLKPLSGRVMLHADFEKPGDRVMIDPAFHANPPSAGIVVHQGDGGGTDFVLDTTTLTPGVHRLVMQNRYDRNPPDSQSGLLVVPFLVAGSTTPPPDATPPTTPTGLTATTTCQNVTLHWQPSTDDSGKVSYRVERRQPFSSLWQLVGASTTTSFTAAWSPSLIPVNGVYGFRVTAIDPTGNTSGPATISLTRSCLLLGSR